MIYNVIDSILEA